MLIPCRHQSRQGSYHKEEGPTSVSLPTPEEKQYIVEFSLFLSVHREETVVPGCSKQRTFGELIL